MMEERRYGDEEAAEIFRAAAEDRPLPPARTRAAEGFTMAELQAIGAEAGLAPDRIAEAASRLDGAGGKRPEQSLLGMPISAGLTVDLPRAPTDREWELLLTDIRETFSAVGTARSQGRLRQWSNGNLHVYLELTDDGHRLRMRTLKGDAWSITAIGFVAVAMALLLTIFIIAGGVVDLVAPIFLGLAGIGALSYNAVRLNRWSETRQEQMEIIGARAVALLSSPESVERIGTESVDRGEPD